MKNINISIVQLEQILTSAKEIPSNIWMFGLNCVSLHSSKKVRQPFGLTRTFDFVRGCFARCRQIKVQITKYKLAN